MSNLSSVEEIEGVEKILAIPELNESQKGLIIVKQAHLEVGDIDTKFLSRGFYQCSAVVLRNPEKTQYGFLHALPGFSQIDRFNQEALEKLIHFTEGQSILIDGYISEFDLPIISFLRKQFGVNCIKTITTGILPPFDVVFRPKSDEVIIAGQGDEIKISQGFE